MRYAYCPNCGIDLETDTSSPIYKVDNYYVNYTGCPICKTRFVLNFNGFCKIVDSEPTQKATKHYECTKNGICEMGFGCFGYTPCGTCEFGVDVYEDL